MKILHTSDWHLGRHLHGQDLEEDHEVILEQVIAAVRSHKPAVLIIAGDIFDRAAPSASAVRQFNRFLSRLSAESQTAVVLIAGNHDSGDRIGAMAALADQSRALIGGPINSPVAPLIVQDDSGPVAFSALPFAQEFIARQHFGDLEISEPADVLKAQIEAAREHVPEGVRWVITAHAFVKGGTPSESERNLAVGGIETVPAETFAGAHYVALGHLHRPQSAGADHIRYSGAPLAFGFDEASTEKSMTLVDLDGAGNAALQFIPFKPLRRLVVVEGELEDILIEGASVSSEDFIKVILTDESPLIDPMKRVREVYPNALQLIYRREVERIDDAGDKQLTASVDEPIEVIREFFLHARKEAVRPQELKLITDALAELQNREAQS